MPSSSDSGVCAASETRSEVASDDPTMEGYGDGTWTMPWEGIRSIGLKSGGVRGGVSSSTGKGAEGGGDAALSLLALSGATMSGEALRSSLCRARWGDFGAVPSAYGGKPMTGKLAEGGGSLDFNGEASAGAWPIWLAGALTVDMLLGALRMLVLVAICPLGVKDLEPVDAELFRAMFAVRAALRTARCSERKRDAGVLAPMGTASICAPGEVGIRAFCSS